MNKNDVNQLIEQGVAAAKADNKEEAEELLEQAVMLDPQNERAWLWLSAVVEGVPNQRECLNRVLEINPTNAFALTGLSFLNHLPIGYEYLAARAPWMAGVEDSRAALATLPDRKCPRCGAVNPGWAYLCNRCSAILEQVDVVRVAKQEIRRRSGSLMRPWAGAAVLDAELAFAPEVVFASPWRAILSIGLGVLALNLLRGVGTLGLAVFATSRHPLNLLDRLAATFFNDLVGLMVGGLVAWLILATLIQGIARSIGGEGSPRVHYYLIAVAISAWMPIAGVVNLLWWAAARLLPATLTSLIASLANGLLMFYAVTLLVQAVDTAHGLPLPRVTITIGLLLTIAIVAYGGLFALSPSAIQPILLKPMQTLLLPLSP